jgi:acyl dehydratase
VSRAGVAVGDTAPERAVGPVEVADFVRYAGASGDFNPLHYDTEHARAAGFDSLFAQGMFSAGVLASFAADWLGPENLRSVRVRFMEIVRLGDTLVCAARITRVDEHAGERLAEVELTCTRQTGATAIRGAATFSLPDAG